MIFSFVTTDKRIAGKAAWVVFTFCTIIMGSLAYFNHWPTWLSVVLGIHWLILTFLTFYHKSSPTFQSIFMMVFSFSNVLMTSIAEENMYPSLFVFLGAAIMLSAYLNELLLLTYALLLAGGVLYHIFVLHTLKLDTSIHIIEFIARFAVLYIALFFLIAIIKKMNRNREKMLQSVEEARTAEQYKSDFLANMSHEIRTPMNAIIGMCELILREDTLSGSVRENAFNIQSSGRNLLAIINDILDYSKIDSGKMELIKEEFNIASILNDVLNMAEARKGSKNIKILVDVDPNIPMGLLGDEVRIKQVVLNLMTNAIKFTEKGSVTLTVSRSVQDYGINLVVSVTDTGIGITEENIESLFTSFQQVDTKKNRAVEGTGLGLAISKNLIRQMGGFISAKSEYGAGSEFRFAIPLPVADDRPFVSVKEADTVHAAACFEESEFGLKQGQLFCEMGCKLGADFQYIETIAKLKEQYSSKQLTHIFVGSEEYLKDSDFFQKAVKDVQVFVIQDRIDTASLSEDIQRVYSPFYVIPVVSALNHENLVLNLNERRDVNIHFIAPKAKILVVDDNVVNLKVAMGLMQPYQMQILTATSGPEAIRMLESADFDLVFMDHMMAGMDGVEATAIIRNMESEYYQKLPIIALTANVANGAREMFLTSGFNDFLAKPIELSALDRVLRNHLPKEYIEAPTEAEADNQKQVERKEKPKRETSPLLDCETGISYIRGNEDAYREILALYVQSGPEKIKRIGELFEQQDLNNYVIEVHALKSTSLNVGATKLSELAKELEAAGKAGNLDATATEKNDALLKLYHDVIEVARNYLGDTDTTQPEPAEETELTEISVDMLRQYLEKALAACRSFDGEIAAKIADETSGYSFEGEALNCYFGKAAQLAEDFEYEAAEKELTTLESKVNAR